MKPMVVLALLALNFVAVAPVLAEDNSERSAPFTPAEREAVYNSSIERRTSHILAQLNLSDAAKAARVRDVILAQYRALRARDEAIDTMLQQLSGNAPGADTNRAAILPILSKPLHDRFLAKLSADLTPEQVEIVKDKMTYDKLKVTYDAYVAIVPNLTDEEKAKIGQLLIPAREEAMDGGSADEKSAIFQKYKDQINGYLKSHGHDVIQATKDWEAKRKAKEEAAVKGTSSPQ